MILGLSIQQWFSFSVLAAVISTVGSLVGVILKDFLFTRSFESWKQRRALEQIYQKYRDPLLLSSRELCIRLAEILKQYPTGFLKSEVLLSNPSKQWQNNIDDKYFQKYKLVSTVYRMCAFLGWLELYRQDVVFLRNGEDEHTIKLEDCITAIRSDLADGQHNAASDWSVWRDTLIFREELRAIGESMIDCKGSSKSVIGYASFNEMIEVQDGRYSRWIGAVTNFLLDLETSGKDFRKVRLQRLIVHLIDLLELLEEGRLDSYFVSLKDEYKDLLVS